MLNLPSLTQLDGGLASRIYLAMGPTDMRKGFDTLAALVKDFLGHDPLSGHLFLFISRSREDVQPIRRDLADLLRRYLAGHAPGRPAWRIRSD